MLNTTVLYRFLEHYNYESCDNLNKDIINSFSNNIKIKRDFENSIVSVDYNKEVKSVYKKEIDKLMQNRVIWNN